MFDMKPYLITGIFKALKETSYPERDAIKTVRFPH